MLNYIKMLVRKGAALRAAPFGIIIFCIGQGMFFLDLAHPYFLGFGPCLFFGLWPPAYFFRYFFWLWPGPAPATINGLPVKKYQTENSSKIASEASGSVRIISFAIFS